MNKTNRKPESDLFLFLWALLIFSLLTMLVFASCSPTHHLNKFYKKGGKIQCDTTTVTVEKIVKGKDGKDSLIYVPITEYVPQIEYKTKWQVRFDNRRFEDSMKYVRRMYKDSVRTVVKVEKVKGKTEVKVQRSKSLPILWLILGFVLAHFIRYLSYIIGAFRNLPNKRL
jgi:hypothetical protein